MNPLDWKAEKKLALGLAAVIGVIVGIMVAYALGYAEASKVTTPFAWWWGRYALASWGWAFFGALIGAGCVYIRELLRISN